MENTSQNVIMISGANRGIGLAITEKLLAEGYRLSLGVRSPEKLPEALRGEGKEQVMVHGYDQYVSYGYPGGLNLED